jgi:aspartate racemase
VAMKTIGLLGGMSWESTALYYRYINSMVRERLGGLHSAELVLLSVDFAPLETMQAAGDWSAAGRLLAGKAGRAEAAGAELLLIATNTMHKVAPQIEEAISIPLLHIADATAVAILAQQQHPSVGLLGTRFTMEQEFYAGRLREKYDLEVLTPSAADREVVHRIIYEELVLGQVNDGSRGEYVRIVEDLVDAGARGVILGCTEIGMLLRPEDVNVPLYDTTRIHAEAAVTAALE